MINQKSFRDQMHRLEVAFSKELSPDAYRFWLQDLEANGITTQTLRTGVDHLIKTGGQYLPSESALIQACSRLKKEIQDREARTQRRENQKREAVDWEENAKNKGAGLASDCVDLIRNLALEAITPGIEYYEAMLGLERKYPGIGFRRQALVYRSQVKTEG